MLFIRLIITQIREAEMTCRYFIELYLETLNPLFSI